MSNTPKRVKPSEVANITPIREQGKAVVQEVLKESRNKFLDFMHTGADIEKIPPTRWQLKGKLVRGGLSALYSEPGLGKSFVAIDMSMAAVLGEQWWGEHFSENCKVLYIAAERHAEVADRVRAACKKRSISTRQLENFTLIASPRPPHVTNDLVDIIEIAQKIKPDLIIFDTFARMTLDSDENSTKDMGVIVENFLKVIHAAGAQCSGLIVHHAGKDKSKGMRGNTALLGAVDAVLKLEKKGDALMLSVDKINAAETPLPAYFAIESIEMPDTENLGEVRSVGVLVSRDYSQVVNGIEGDLLSLCCELYNEGASVAELCAAYNAEHKPLGKDAAKTEKHTIRRALTRLIEQGSMLKDGKASKTIYLPTAKALASYKEAKPTN